MRFCILLGASMIGYAINPELGFPYKMGIPIIIVMILGGVADIIEFMKNYKED
jgi:hypothetical protein